MHRKQNVAKITGSQLEVGDVVFTGSYTLRSLFDKDKRPVLVTSIVESTGRAMGHREVSFATTWGEVTRTGWPEDEFTVQAAADHTMGSSPESGPPSYYGATIPTFGVKL